MASISPVPSPAGMSQDACAGSSADETAAAAINEQQDRDPSTAQFRYIRVNPRAVPCATPQSLPVDLATAAAQTQAVSWAPGFFRLAASVKLAQCPAYRSAQVYGMDASSAAPVLALQPEPGQHVLDLCCAPGGKLAMLADAVSANGRATGGSVTGVDASATRLDTCRRLCRKYRVPGVRLFLADGRCFDLPAPRWHDDPATRPAYPRKAKRRRIQRQPRALADAPTLTHAAPVTLSQAPVCDEDLPSHSCLYDAVLVDTQCTHDASHRHLAKWQQDAQAVRAAAAEPQVASELQLLQRQLLANGLARVRPGGVVVYSTCSASEAQNEDIVRWAIQQADVPVDVEPVPGAAAMPVVAGTLQHSVYFDPSASQCSGLFLTRLRRRSGCPE